MSQSFSRAQVVPVCGMQGMKIFKGLREFLSRVHDTLSHVEGEIEPVSIDCARLVSGDVATRRRIIKADADMTNCAQITRLLATCRKSVAEGAVCLAVDLRCVQVADTKLIACLVAVYQMAKASSVRLELFVSRQVIEIADVCRLRTLLERTLPRSE